MLGGGGELNFFFPVCIITDEKFCAMCTQKLYDKIYFFFVGREKIANPSEMKM